MQHSFANIPEVHVSRSSFDRSHGVSTTLDAGWLVPVYVDEALPGDTHNLHMNAFARMATPINPVFSNIYMDTFFFSVPVRLVWDNFVRFNGEQPNPGDSTDFVTPKMTSPAGGYTNQSLSDYLGLPTLKAGIEHVSYFHRAYNLIWNEWFRDQNLQTRAPMPKGDGPDNVTDFVLRRRGKRHDYFTSCLPWPQKGPAVTLPLGSTAPVYGTGQSLGLTNGTQTFGIHPAASNGVGYSQEGYNKPNGTTLTTFTTVTTNRAAGVVTSGASGLVADLSSASASTVNLLRNAFALQSLYEKDARGGTRYTEVIRAHFGVISPDARLQRPEYLGGSSTPINIIPIAQTSSTDGTSPQGNLSAMGTFQIEGRQHGFVKSFTEHTIIIGLVAIRADLVYQQGLNRMFSRNTRWDFFWPDLAHIGEQAVLNKEIFAQGSAAPTVDAQVFGYQERFAEYRYKPTIITGKMRSNDPQPLDSWHLAQNFATLPTLNNTFIEENPPIGRVIAVPSEPHFLLDVWHNLNSVRPMPMYGVPGFGSRF